MKVPETQVNQNPPALIASLIAGFDAVTRNIMLILIPVILDLLLWWGPHLKISKLIQIFTDQMLSFPQQSPEATQYIQTSREIWQYISDHLNLMIALRSYPVGVPSLMVSRLPLQTPGIMQPASWDITNFWVGAGTWLLLTLFGVITGTFYFLIVANASVKGSRKLSSFVPIWLGAFFQVVLLSLFFLILLVAISIPAGCILSVLALGSPAIGRIALFLYGGGIIWLLFPLLFSPHGIFINRNNVLESVRKAVRITRMTLPTTSLLFLSILLLSQGLDILWGSPNETSWFALLGITGHAFITTGLLATSFIYYNHADQWIQKVMAQHIQPPAVQVNRV